MKNNNLPVISVLSFKDCVSSLKGKLKLLFKSPWPTLEYLDLRGCELDQSDIHVFAAEHGLIPNLKTLNFGFSIRFSDMIDRRPCCMKEHIIDDSVFSVFRQCWPTLTTLSLHDVCKRQYERITTVLTAVFLPNLSDLAICMWQHAPMWRKKQVQTQMFVEGQANKLALWEQLDTIDKMPEIKHHRLRQLTLQQFVCAATHLYTVARSSLSCRLDKLDISYSSYITGYLFILVGHRFPSLQTLILSYCQLNATDLRSLARACKRGRLPELTMLDVSHNSNLGGCLNLLLNCVLESLKNLILVDCGLQTCDLKHLALAKSEERLPELRHLDISDNIQISGQLEHLFCFDQNWDDLLTLKLEQKHAFANDFEVLLAKISSHALEHLQDLTVTSDSTEFLDPSKNLNFEGSNLCKLKIVLPFHKYSREKLFLYFSDVIGKCGLKKLRILSVIRVNFRDVDDEDYNCLFARLFELISCLEPFTFSLLYDSRRINIEQIAQNMIAPFDHLLPFDTTRKHVSAIQPILQRFFVSQPHEYTNTMADVMTYLFDAIVNVSPVDTDWSLIVDPVAQFVGQNGKTAIDGFRTSLGNQVCLNLSGVFVFVDTSSTH